METLAHLIKVLNVDSLVEATYDDTQSYEETVDHVSAVCSATLDDLNLTPSAETQEALMEHIEEHTFAQGNIFYILRGD